MYAIHYTFNNKRFPLKNTVPIFTQTVFEELIFYFSSSKYILFRKKKNILQWDRNYCLFANKFIN